MSYKILTSNLPNFKQDSGVGAKYIQIPVLLRKRTQTHYPNGEKEDSVEWGNTTTPSQGTLTTCVTTITTKLIDKCPPLGSVERQRVAETPYTTIKKTETWGIDLTATMKQLEDAGVSSHLLTGIFYQDGDEHYHFPKDFEAFNPEDSGIHRDHVILKDTGEETFLNSNDSPEEDSKNTTEGLFQSSEQDTIFNNQAAMAWDEKDNSVRRVNFIYYKTFTVSCNTSYSEQCPNALGWPLFTTKEERCCKSISIPTYLVVEMVPDYAGSAVSETKPDWNEDNGDEAEAPVEDTHRTRPHHLGLPSHKTIASRKHTPGRHWGDTGEYDYIYVPPDLNLNDNDNGLVISGDTFGGVGFEDDRIDSNFFVTRLKLSLDNPNVLVFEEVVAYDSDGKLHLNDKVFCAIKGTTYFLGRVKDINRELTPSASKIVYTAVGIRRDLKSLPFAVQLKLTNRKLSELYEEALNYTPSTLISSWDLSNCPDIRVPKITLSAVTFDTFFQQLLAYTGYFAYYIDTSKKFTLLDLKNGGTSHILYIPPKGTKVFDDYNFKYIVLSQKLNFDVSRCKTRAIIYGDYYKRTRKVHCGASYSRSKDAYHFHIDTGGGELLDTLPGNQSIVIEVKNPETDEITSTSPIHIDKQNNLIWFEYSSTDSNGNPFSHVSVSAIIGIRYGLIKYDTGFEGTAYSQKGVQDFIFELNPSFQKYDLYNGDSRDDSAELAEYAEKRLEPFKDVKWGGQVVLKGIVTDIKLGDHINFSGTEQDWSNLNMVVKSITYDFKSKTTMLELTNNYWLYTGVIDPQTDEVYKQLHDNLSADFYRYHTIRKII